MPPSDNTATSVVPPPMSTTREPVGSVTGRPAPMAAAIGSSISQTRRAPALSAAFLDGTAFNGRRSRRHADDDLGAGQTAPVVDLADELLDHLFGHFEIGDDAVP